MSRALRLALVPLLAACPSDAPLTPGPGTEGEASTSTSTGVDAPTTGVATEPVTTGTGTSTGEPTSTGTTEQVFDPPEPACGNGYVEADEECDDGNAADGDGCTAACLIPCGLEREYIELAPSAQSNIRGTRVLAAADGGVVAISELQKITLDMEGMQDTGPRQILVVAYDPDGAKRWERELGPDDGDLDPGGGAIDASGAVFVAGSLDGADGVDVWVSKLAAADGTTVWAAAHDGLLAESDDVPRGLAVTPEGDVVVSAQVYDVAQDSDVWLRKLKGSNGDEVWTTTWSGAPDNGFSVDRGQHVAVDGDGNVFALAREYVNFKRLEVTLLKFGPGGGEPLWTVSPLADGTDHAHEPRGLAVDAAGDVVIAASRDSTGPTFWVFKYTADGDPVWDMDRLDFEDGGEDWNVSGLAIASDGDVIVGGYWYNEEENSNAGWYEAWLARLGPDGARHCQVSARGTGEDILPPSLFAFDVSGGPGNVALVTGRRVENEEYSLWTALFRPL